MSARKLLGALACALLVSSAASAGEVAVLNLNSQGATSTTPTITDLELSAGTYDFTLVDPSTNADAIYTAWSFTGGGETGTWGTEFETLGSAASDTAEFGAFTFSATEIDAFNDSPVENGNQIVVPFDQTVEFFVGDSLYSDNTGGVSVEIDSVSTSPSNVPDAPGTAMLLGLGTVCLVWMRPKVSDHSVRLLRA
jgi:hypothetical protein